MTKDEALRLALDALEYLATQIKPDYEHSKAITAIKAALEAKDEPVAWRDAAIRLGEELSSVGPNGYYDMDAKEWLDWAMKQNPRGEHSLPKRKPLTDAEVGAIAIKSQDGISPHDDTLSFARAIEAAHGIIDPADLKGEA